MIHRLLSTSTAGVGIVVGWFVVVAPWAVAADRASFVKAHCHECHGGLVQEAGLDLEALDPGLATEAGLTAWIKVFDRVERGEMPPEDGPVPDPAARTAFLASLKADLLAADRAKIAVEGRSGVRRLNRIEYENSLRDLLALPRLDVKNELPEDGMRHGFDKVGGALEISHVQMAKYLEVARSALRQAVVPFSERPETVSWREPAALQWSARSAISSHNAAPLEGKKLAGGLTTVVRGNPRDDPGNSYRAAVFSGEAQSVAVLSGVMGAHQPEGLQIDRFKPPVPGWYRVRFSIWGLRWNRDHAEASERGWIRKYNEFGDPPFQDEQGRWQLTRLDKESIRQEHRENVEFYGEGSVATHVVRASLRGEPLGYFDAPSLQPTEHELTVWLDPGDKLSFHAMTLPASGPPNWGSAQGVRSYEGPGVAYDWFEVTGPLIEDWPPTSQQRLFGKQPVAAIARPFVQGAPTIEPGTSETLDPESLTGTGLNVGGQRMINVNGRSKTTVNLATAGRYEWVLRAYETPGGDESAQMQLLVDGKPLRSKPFVMSARRDKPQVVRVAFDVPTPGPVELGVEFLNDYFDADHPDPERRDRNLVVAGIELQAPPRVTAPDEVDEPQLDVDGLLVRFADRAFRRPVTADELADIRGLVQARLAAGDSVEDAVLSGYAAILCSPDFLFVGLESEGRPRSDHALAARLSYFLWNSLPDDELRRLADAGRLTDPAVLREQTERLLNDSKSERFVRHFLDQWLNLREIDFTSPDPQLYPEFDPWLRDAMLDETRAYFRLLVDENLDVRHLIDADFVLANQRLAELYGLRGVDGASLRKVPLPEDSPRGGFLTQASVLKVTANGTATSPVLRGVWVAERLLGVPLDPPPPNIPAVEPDATGATTIRELIEMHRADRACASCHAKMDPPGMALESFDPIGGWREHYRIDGRPKMIRVDGERRLEPSVQVISSRNSQRVQLRIGSPVDAAGVLADGRAFGDIFEMKALLVTEPASLAENLIDKLLIYATGQELRFSDRETLHALVDQAARHKFGVRELIHDVVQGELFRTAGLRYQTE